MATKLADQLVQQLLDAGVHRIYGIVGDSLNPVVDAVRRTGGAAKGGIDWVHVRHEEAAAFAAAADAQLTGELAVCAGSCGPGNLHLINGLYDANRSHAPVLAIASHIPSQQIGMGYFQETHPDRLFTECSVYSEMISSPVQSPRVVNSAIRHAVALRGVAVITLPGDLADQDAAGTVPRYVPAQRGSLVPSDEVVAELATMINNAKKVAIFAGAGVEGAHDEVIQLAATLNAPIGHSLRGKDFIQYDNPFDVGMTGLLGYGAAAEGMQEADLLLLLGTDFPYDQFLPNVTTVQVDSAAEVLGRRTGVDLPIHADVLATVKAVSPLVQPKDDRFLKATLKRHEKLMTKAVGAYTRNVEKHKPIHPEWVASILDELADDDAIFTADTGMCNVWTARYINPNGRRRLIGSFLHGSMANALPHAIGASISHPGRQVISVSGDGGLSMLLGELITAQVYDLPITVVVFNNSTLGMVKLEMLVDGLPDFGTDVPGTDYSKVAEAIGFHAQRVDDPRDVRAALTAALKHHGPSLVEVITDPNALSVPPGVTGEQLFGFATAMSKIVLNRGAGEAVAMAKSNPEEHPPMSSMRIAIAGSHGLIGHALTQQLRRDGHEVVRLVRRAPVSPDEAQLSSTCLDDVDAVINVAGAGIANARWTQARKRELVDSRLRTTETIVAALEHSQRCLTFLSGSAIGYYGDAGDRTLTEQSGAGSGFLADLVQQWEAAARRAPERVRVVTLRTGHVIALNGGLIGKQKLIYQAGLGGRIGSGQQWVSWISLRDWVSAAEHLLTSSVSGPVNFVGPAPVRNLELTRALGAEVPSSDPVAAAVGRCQSRLRTRNGGRRDAGRAAGGAHGAGLRRVQLRRHDHRPGAGLTGLTRPRREPRHCAGRHSSTTPG